MNDNCKPGSLEAHEREIFLIGVGVGRATASEAIRETDVLGTLALWKRMRLPR